MQPIIAVQRFGLGAAGGELARLGSDPRAALLAQLDRPPAQARDVGLPDTATTVGLVMRQRRLVQQRRVQSAEPGAGMAPPAIPEADFPSPGQVLQADLGHRIETAIGTPAPLIERLALHWLNHFTVSATAVPLYVGYFGASFEQEAVRPHLLGRFEDMLLATAIHPAMLCYLDNRVSTGPNSPRGLRRKVGLNENLGREILELHTLGVDGGYAQEDVIGLARILTGWTIDVGINDTPDAERLRFDPAMHEPGPQMVLGHRYPDTGPDQLKAVLRDLAHHPSTARHVTRRMVRHFLGDAATAGGDLRAVTRALVQAPAAGDLPLAKLRPPIELMLATARLLGRAPAPPQPMAALRAMGQPYRGAAAPAGWPEADDAWGAPDAVKTRLDWALELAARQPAGLDARALLDQAFGAAASAETRRTVARAADPRQALVLLLMSPEYQRR
ncbi:MAG: DUF1800 domain-containing protein [Acetobacteraceae bacterium]|nr:MAG: DUF1800 domain-containing protein [Acetobacteraceae bacterium]